MKVKDLINELNKMPGDADVVFEVYGMDQDEWSHMSLFGTEKVSVEFEGAGVVQIYSEEFEEKEKTASDFFVNKTNDEKQKIKETILKKCEERETSQYQILTDSDILDIRDDLLEKSIEVDINELYNFFNYLENYESEEREC